jgi:hypothetical protein
VEVTCRTLQGRLLLRPSPELNEIIAGARAGASGCTRSSCRPRIGEPPWQFKAVSRRLDTELTSYLGLGRVLGEVGLTKKLAPTSLGLAP